MTEREVNEQPEAADAPHCPACGAVYDLDDRFCARCGTALPAASALAAALPPEPPAAQADDPAVLVDIGAAPPAKRAADPIWVFGARPSTVASGGLLLMLLALALLLVGQRDHTGTIVMLSICLAPLALFTLAVGVVRWVTGRR